MNTQTFNISLPRELVKKVDKVAKEKYRSRSGLIREALRIYLRRADEWNQMHASFRKKTKKTNQRKKERGEI